MKKTVLSVVFILLFFSLSLRSSIATFSFMNVAFAQEEMVLKEATGTSEAAAKNKIVEYTLPYPGLLPDNPLYFLKAARDRIVGLLISDPLKKAEFNLLAADKRLNSGIFLFNKGKEKYNLAISTVSKGENYFEEAISKVNEAKKQGMDTNDILRRLWESAKKHQEVLISLEKTLGKDFKESIVVLQKRAGDFEKQVNSLRK